MNSLKFKVMACLLALGLSSEVLYSQCGTVVPSSHKTSPLVMPAATRDIIEYDLDRTLSVHVHILASGFQVYNYSAADYLPIWEEASLAFDPIGLDFEICIEELIPNYQYGAITAAGIIPSNGFRPEVHMTAEFYTENVINVYYVGAIENPAEGQVNGYTYFPGGKDLIVLEYSHNASDLVHSLGHFLGLYHTFENTLGYELVDGSNCETTGDLLCDTPADFNGAYNEPTCTYTSLIEDDNGQYYTPFLSNYMSLYGDCKSEFTIQQYNRMAYMLLTERSYLW